MTSQDCVPSELLTCLAVHFALICIIGHLLLSLFGLFAHPAASAPPAADMALSPEEEDKYKEEVGEHDANDYNDDKAKEQGEGKKPETSPAQHTAAAREHDIAITDGMAAANYTRPFYYRP